MTFNDFRTWLEGFEAAFVNGQPNPEQLLIIKDKLAAVQADCPVGSEHKYVFYRNPPRGRWPSIEPKGLPVDALDGNVVEAPPKSKSGA